MWQLLVGPVSDLLNTVLKRILPPEKMSEEERAKLEAQLTIELSKMDWQGIAGQLEINKIEAQSEKWWKAGWRPFVGWTCGSALLYNFMLQPLMQFMVLVWYKNTLPPFPTLDIGPLMIILGGLLGFGGMRTYEKYKGIN